MTVYYIKTGSAAGLATLPCKGLFNHSVTADLF